MPFKELEIRPIRPADLPGLRAIGGTAGMEFPRPADRSLYFVAVWSGMVMGGAGIAPLAGADRYTCELTGLRVRAGLRHRLVADALIRHCHAAAKQFLYARCCHETQVHALRASAREWFDGLPTRSSFDGVTACALLGASPR